MNIAVFTDSYQPYVSGVVRSIDTFGAELIEMGHKVYVFGPRYYPHDAEEQTVPGGERPPAVKVFRFWSIPVPHYRGFTAPVPISTQAEQLLADLRIDIIHSHTPFAMGTLGSLLSRRTNIPLVFTHHTMYHEYVHYLPGVRNVLRNMMLRYVGKYCQKADLIITPTPLIKQFAVDAYDLGDKPVHAIPTGIDTEQFGRGDAEWLRTKFSLPADEPVLIFVGRLGREKNVAFLLDALQKVARTVPRVHLVLVGDGPERDKLSQRAAEIGLQNRVHLTGVLPKEKVIDAFHGADLFVIASTTETQGLATLEAMAAGLPVVGVRAPGTSDMVEPEVQGLLTEEDADAFAQAAVRVLQDGDLYGSMAAAALRRAETFSARNMAKRLVAAYEQLLPVGLQGRAGRDSRVSMEIEDAR